MDEVIHLVPRNSRGPSDIPSIPNEALRARVPGTVLCDTPHNDSVFGDIAVVQMPQL